MIEDNDRDNPIAVGLALLLVIAVFYTVFWLAAEHFAHYERAVVSSTPE